MKLCIAILFCAAVSVSAFAPVLPFAPVSRAAMPLRMVSEAAEKPTVKRLPQSAVEIAIPVPGTATEAAYTKVCRELSKNISVPGFRKGSKIPPQVLEQAMAAKGGRNALKVQAINELVGQLVEPALKEQALEPIGQPSLVVSAEDLADDFKPGESLTLSVKCDVWPEIQWSGSYEGLTGKYQRKPFNQEKLDKALEDLKERYATLEPIADASHVLEMGDACVVNMEGYLADASGEKGDPLPNAASGDRVEVVLGKGRYMEGLVEGLVGAKVGDLVTVKVTFPGALRDKTLAGKQAIFDVEVLEASKRTVPELTDEFAAKVRAGLTKDSLLDELRKAIDEEDAKDYVGARNKALSDGLSKIVDMEVPDTLVTNQAREKYAVMMSEMRDSGVSDEEIKRQITPENFLKYKDIVKDDIARDFKVSMATDEIARMEGIEVPAYQVEEQMESIRKDAAENSEEMDENMIRAKVETTLQRQAVMDWLAERSNLEVEYMDEKFDEKLLDQLAEESLEREKKMAEEAAAKQGKTAVAEPVVEEPVKAEAAVVEPGVVEPEVVEPEVVEPVAEKETKSPAEPTATEEDEEARAARYASMSLEERAFAALVETGAVEVHKDPSDPDYDSSQDDEIVD